MSKGVDAVLERAASPTVQLGDSVEDIAHDVSAVGRIAVVPKLLSIICTVTGMGFAAVARVSDSTWTACAVRDDIKFGLPAGGQLDLSSTLCAESRAMREPITIDHASEDPIYFNHHTPRTYKIESYISVPIVLANGRYFGNLCAIDPAPAQVSDKKTLAIFKGFSELIAVQLDLELQRETVENALKDERAASELREQFIAVLGHDLRNPLQSIAAASELLERKFADNPAVAQMGMRLKKSVKRMSALIDDVLDFARGRLGSGIGISLTDVGDFEGALAHVVEELQDAHSDRQITLSVNVARPVRCDLARVQQLASNLISNALTHGSSQSPVKVTARADHHELVMEVWNDGEPIRPETVDKIFDPFWREVTSKDRQGLGLGLHICSQIVRAHRGKISVLSSQDAGTTFTVRLPVSA